MKVNHSEKNIQWVYGEIENVKIEFSIDDGNTWQEPAGSVPALTGSYNFTVPDTPSDQCRIRLSDASNPEVTDTSELFEIIRPTLSINHNPITVSQQLQEIEFKATVTSTSRGV